MHEREKRGLDSANCTRPREKMGESSACERAKRGVNSALAVVARMREGWLCAAAEQGAAAVSLQL